MLAITTNKRDMVAQRLNGAGYVEQLPAFQWLESSSAGWGELLTLVPSYCPPSSSKALLVSR